MNPMVGETENPLVQATAKVIGDGISWEKYSAQTYKRGDPDYCMSRGELMEFDRCPHRWLMGYESEETKQTNWGELIDCLILSPAEFEDRFAVTPATYTNKQGKEIKWRNDERVEEVAKWMADNAHKKPLKNETATQAINASKFLMADREIQILLNGALTQVMVTAEYQDDETELTVPLRVLLDVVPSLTGSYGKCLADLKTCNTAALFPWTKAVFQHEYHVQAALYLDAYVAATGEDRTDWLHVCQESYPPWEIGKRLLSAEFVELGRLKYVSALKRYCQCLKTGIWPGYDDGQQTINGWSLVNPEAWMCQ